MNEASTNRMATVAESTASIGLQEPAPCGAPGGNPAVVPPLTPLPHDATRDACAAVHGDLQAPPAAPAPPASGLETGEGGSYVTSELTVNRLTDDGPSVHMLTAEVTDLPGCTSILYNFGTPERLAKFTPEMRRQLTDFVTGLLELLPE